MPDGTIVFYDKGNPVRQDLLDEYLQGIDIQFQPGNPGSADGTSNPDYGTWGYRDVPVCIRESAAIRDLAFQMTGFKSVFSQATSRNIAFFYILDEHFFGPPMVRMTGISGPPNRVGAMEKAFEQYGFLQSAPYDPQHPGLFVPDEEADGHYRDTCSEWKFVQWFIQTYPNFSKVSLGVWFYSDRYPCPSCRRILNQLKSAVAKAGGSLTIEWDYDPNFESAYPNSDDFTDEDD